MGKCGFNAPVGRRALLLDEGELVSVAARAVGLVVEWREDLQSFAVVSGKWPRPCFQPLDSDADAFLLPCWIPDLPLDLILFRAHEAFNQVELIPRYVRRNLVIAAAERALAAEEVRNVRDW